MQTQATPTCTIFNCNKPATHVYYSTLHGIRTNDAFVCSEHDAQIQAIDPVLAAQRVKAAQLAGQF